MSSTTKKPVAKKPATAKTTVKTTVKKPATAKAAVKKPSKKQAFEQKKSMQLEEQKTLASLKRKFMEEEGERIAFLLELSEYDDYDSITELLEDFSKEGSANKTFSQVLTALPPQNYHKLYDVLKRSNLGEEYTIITTLKYIEKNKFYNHQLEQVYGSISDFIKAQEKKFDKILESFMTKKEREEFAKKLELLQRKQVVRQETRPPPQIYDASTGSVIPLLPIEIDRKYDRIIHCIDDYSKKIWIPFYAGEYYIHGTINDDVLIDSHLVDKNESIVLDNVKYYRANPSFDMILCTSLAKQQKDFTFSAMMKDGRKINVMIAYKIHPPNSHVTYLKQDEDLYKKELQWIGLQSTSISVKSKYFLNNNGVLNGIDGKEEIVNICRKNLMNYFDEKSADELVHLALQKASENSSSSLNIQIFLEEMARMVIFLDEKYMGDKSRFLHDKIKSNVLSPEEFFTLSPKEILQEIYENPKNYVEMKGPDDNSFTMIDQLSSVIQRQKNNYISDIVKNYLYLLDNTQKKPDANDQKEVFFYPSNLIHNDKILVNNSTNTIVWEDISYTDPRTGQENTFNIKKLLHQFLQYDYINHQTHKKFDKKFIDMIMNEYTFKDAKWTDFYYRDVETNQVYFFDLFEIVEQISSGNYINKYSGQRFSEDFINDVKKYKIDRVVSPVNTKTAKNAVAINAINEESKNNRNLLLLFDELNKSERKMISSTGCPDYEIVAYFNEFTLNKNSILEPILNKTNGEKDDIIDFVKYAPPSRSPKQYYEPHSPINSPPRSPKQEVKPLFDKTKFGKKKK